MPKSTIFTWSGNARVRSRFTTSTPNASSPRKMFPMPATNTSPFTRDLVFQSQRLDFLRGKEKAMTGLTQHSEITAWVIFDDDRNMKLVIKIALNCFHDRDLSL